MNKIKYVFYKKGQLNKELTFYVSGDIMNLQKIQLKEAKEMIDSNFKYFNDNFEELCKSYLGKYIVIKDESVIGCYNSFDEAFDETIKTEEIGSFLIQLCSSDEDNNINYFYSNNVVFA